ncbi:MAG: hypothetical protein LBK56_14610 [Gracilibacteraceae bacterium]|nr:hypothetical protein [Gracilibacteraceae bacterium]
MPKRLHSLPVLRFTVVSIQNANLDFVVFLSKMRTYSLSTPFPPRLSGVTADIGIIAILKAENNVSEKNRQNICTAKEIFHKTKYCVFVTA